MRIFCEFCCIFPSPAEAKKNTSNEQNVRSYYMLNHRITGLLFHYKKNCYFAIGFFFLVRVFRNTLLPSVRMTLTMSKMFALVTCQTIEWEVNYSTAKKMIFWLLLSILFSSPGSFSSAIVAPSASAGVRPVVNRLNQDTTVYYGLVFCAFSWPYMAKWHDSGVIIAGNTSIDMRNMGVAILDTLLRTSVINKAQRAELYKQYFNPI